LKVDNEGLIKKGFEKDHHIREMKQHMELRNMCIQEAESTIKEQSKGMQKMSNYL
jgi:TATA-binding protein-associated factor Taf7